MAKIFNKTTELVADFNNYLDSIAQAALIFQALMRDYLRGDMENLQVHLKELQERETRCDELRREIRFRLYSRMLIPENRGDVLSILENADRMVDKLKAVAVKLDIEQTDAPRFPSAGYERSVPLPRRLRLISPSRLRKATCPTLRGFTICSPRCISTSTRQTSWKTR
jgi:hypothetical protein